MAPSRAILKELLDIGVSEDRIDVIPNGVDTGLFSPPTPSEKTIKKGELGLDEGNIALYMGRIEQPYTEQPLQPIF